MFVALDKPTAVRMYDFISEYWADYLKELETKIDKVQDQQEQLELQKQFERIKETEICVVVSPEQNEIQKFKNLELNIEPHREKMVSRNLEKEFKDEANPFRLVIVCSMWITGFDVPCVSTMYLDKPIAGHTLMQTIARANRVYDDEKENGLIVDYGNVYEQLKKAYLVYGNSDSNGEKKPKPDNTLKLAELVTELQTAIEKAWQFLQNLNFDLDILVNAETPLDRLSALSAATNAVCLNEKTRYEFEALANNVSRKYKALYPEEELKPYMAQCRALDAIYKQLNQKTASADISAAVKELQKVVDGAVTVDKSGETGAEIDISQLDFDKLQQAFQKSDAKNKMMFDLHKAVEAKLKRMVQDNPLRLDFYKEYERIIEQYNNGKDVHAVEKAFNDVQDFINTKLNPESSRAFAEGLDEETLAIFDLLKKPTLTPEEITEVKKVAKETLKRLKEEVLMFERWRSSTQLTSKAITIIRDDIKDLPEKPYPDAELIDHEIRVYQHIYSCYVGGQHDLHFH